jgi:hypothetical protein
LPDFFTCLGQIEQDAPEFLISWKSLRYPHSSYNRG